MGKYNHWTTDHKHHKNVAAGSLNSHFSIFQWWCLSYIYVYSDLRRYFYLWVLCECFFSFLLIFFSSALVLVILSTTLISWCTSLRSDMFTFCAIEATSTDTYAWNHNTGITNNYNYLLIIILMSISVKWWNTWGTEMDTITASSNNYIEFLWRLSLNLKAVIVISDYYSSKT